MAKDCALELAGGITKPRNRANENAERLAIADQIAWWRNLSQTTSDPMKLASYRRIITDLCEIAERMQNAG